MTEVVLFCCGAVAAVATTYAAMRFMAGTSEQKQRWLASAIFFVATLSPIVVTLMSPRSGTGGGFTEFSSGPQSAGVSLIIRAVGYFLLIAAPLLVLIRVRSKFVIPGGVLTLIAYAAIGWVSSVVNEQPVNIDLFYPALTVTAVMLACKISPGQALTMTRTSLRVYVWLSLALAVVAPGLVFWDGQGRTWFGLSQLAGVTTHPNGMGTVAALAMAVELIRVDGLKRPKPWHILAAAIALLATQSRGAWISAAVGLVIYLSIRSGARLIMILAPVVLSVGLASSAIFTEFANALAHWSAGGDISTLNGRTEIWQNALAAVERSPMFGTGPRSFDLEYRADALGLGSLISSSNAHNQIIQTLVERGILGLSILAVLLVGLFKDAFRAGSPMRAGLMAFLAVFISRFAVETPLYIATATLNGAVLLLVVVLITSAGNTPARRPQFERLPQDALPSSYKRLGRASAPPSVTNAGTK